MDNFYNLIFLSLKSLTIVIDYKLNIQRVNFDNWSASLHLTVQNWCNNIANNVSFVVSFAVEIMISNTQKYNENLQHMRQVEIEQVHNFAEFR